MDFQRLLQRWEEAWLITLAASTTRFGAARDAVTVTNWPLTRASLTAWLAVDASRWEDREIPPSTGESAKTVTMPGGDRTSFELSIPYTRLGASRTRPLRGRIRHRRAYPKYGDDFRATDTGPLPPLTGPGLRPSPPSVACATQSEGAVPPLSGRVFQGDSRRVNQHARGRAEPVSTRHPGKGVSVCESLPVGRCFRLVSLVDPRR